MVNLWNQVPAEVWNLVTPYFSAGELLSFAFVNRRCYALAVLRFSYYNKMVIGIRNRLGYPQFKLYKDALRFRYYDGEKARIHFLILAAFLVQFQREELKKLHKKFPELKLEHQAESVDAFIKREQLIEDLNLLLFIKNIRTSEGTFLFAIAESNPSPSTAIVFKQAMAIRNLLSIFGVTSTLNLVCSRAGLTRVSDEHLKLRTMIQIDFSENEIWKLPRKMSSRITYKLTDNPVDILPFQFARLQFPYPRFLFSKEQIDRIVEYFERVRMDRAAFKLEKGYSFPQLVSLRRKIWQIRSEIFYSLKYGLR